MKRKNNLLVNNENEFRYVQVVIEFYRIGEIDTMNEKYQAEIHIESKWVENDTDIVEYDPKKHWNPKLYIENAFQEPKEHVTYEISKENENTFITEIRHVKGVFWER